MNKAQEQWPRMESKNKVVRNDMRKMGLEEEDARDRERWPRVNITYKKYN